MPIVERFEIAENAMAQILKLHDAAGVIPSQKTRIRGTVRIGASAWI